jgi:Transglycosylase SLT domain
LRLERAFCVPNGVTGRAFCVPGGVAGRTFLLLLLLLLAGPALRAEYVVLRSGLRLKVTGYQLVGDKYRLQMPGGKLEIAAEEVVAIEPEDSFGPPATVQVDPQPLYRDLVEATAKRYNMDADLITSVIAVESNFDPKAVSRKNAHGLMQLLPETAAQLGVKNIDDPAENIDAGTRYLRDLLQKYNNNLALALAAYNAGTDKVQLYGSVPPYRETISYVRRVKRGYEKNKAESSKKTPAANAQAAKTPVTKSSAVTTPATNEPAPQTPPAKTLATPAPGAVAGSSPPRNNQSQ